MEKQLFGTLPTGEPIYLCRLKSGDACAQIISYGAALVSFCPFGDMDIVGGFDTLDGFLQDTSNQGAVVGRVANRIANAQFSMDGRIYTLPDNDNGNCLHGGIGFQRRAWTVKNHDESSVALTYFSPDGEEGFPAGLSVTVTYRLEGTALVIAYEAVPDGKTPIALTNHAYFNLDGLGGDIKNHTVQIFADRYTAVDDRLIPTGEHPLVEGTPLDLRSGKAVGAAFDESFSGYDHNYLLSPTVCRSFAGREIGLAAKAWNDAMELRVYTDQPGLQFYTGNFLGDGPAFKDGIPQIRHGAFCLEAQTEPDCVNHGEAFYDAGGIYRQLTVYEIVKK